jgi:sporulation protein YqfC
MERRKGILEQAAELFDLPKEQLAGIPKLELVGDSELRMIHHRGILAYGTQEIHISGGQLLVRVEGQGLELKAMNGDELLITGEIRRLEVE